MAKAMSARASGALAAPIAGTLLGKDSMDIDAYVTNKALEGLFKMVAAGRTADTAESGSPNGRRAAKVFGALKK